MLKAEQGIIAPGYVELSDATLEDLDTLATTISSIGIDGPQGHALHSIGYGSGETLCASVGRNEAELIRQQLTANMSPVLIEFFDQGFRHGMINQEMAEGAAV